MGIGDTHFATTDSIRRIGPAQSPSFYRVFGAPLSAAMGPGAHASSCNRTLQVERPRQRRPLMCADGLAPRLRKEGLLRKGVIRRKAREVADKEGWIVNFVGRTHSNIAETAVAQH